MKTVHLIAPALAAMLLAACGGKTAGKEGTPRADTLRAAPGADTARVADGPVQYRAPDGHVTMEGHMRNGQRQGQWTSYTADGRVKSRNNYADGVPEGLSTVFHPNGQVYYTGWQHAGKQVGIWRFYDEQGKLQRTVDYGDAHLSTPADTVAKGR